MRKMTTLLIWGTLLGSALAAQDIDLSRHNPVAASAVAPPQGMPPVPVTKRLSTAQMVRAAQALEAAKGSPRLALKKLLTQHDPDSLMAMVAMEHELAPQGSSGPQPPAEPAVKAETGRPGILEVAEVAGLLLDRRTSPAVDPVDNALLEEHIRLLGFYGAPAATPGSAHTEVIQVLRRALTGGENLQILSSKALGLLGDLDTAREIIADPEKYPSASIGDFGTVALDLYKARQMSLLQSHSGEKAFFQDMQLGGTRKQKDMAIDLAIAGSAGAAMAMQRNQAEDAMRSDDPDGRVADAWEKFMITPVGSRDNIVAGSVAGEFQKSFVRCGGQDKCPKTCAALLKALEHDLRIIFDGRKWQPDELYFLGPYTNLLLHDFHQLHSEDQKIHPWYSTSLVNQEMALFKRYWKPRVNIDSWTHEISLHGDRVSLVDAMSLYGRHLGLPPIQFADRDMQLAYRKWVPSVCCSPEEMEKKLKTWEIYGAPPEAHVCIKLGHIKDLEDY